MRRKSRKHAFRTCRLELESLEPREVPGSVLNHLALGPIGLLGSADLYGLDHDLGPRWPVEDETAAVSLLNSAESGSAPGAPEIDEFWAQPTPGASGDGVASDGPPNGSPATVPAPADGGPLGALGATVVLSALNGGTPLTLNGTSASGGGGGSPAAGASDGTAGGGGGAAPAATTGATAGEPGTGVPAIPTGAGAPSLGQLFGGAAVGSTGQPAGLAAAASNAIRPPSMPTISVPQFDLHGWLQAEHGLGVGLRGFAARNLLSPAPLDRTGSAYAGPRRVNGAPLAALSHGGQGGVGFGVATPPPGQAGPTLAAVADQAAAHIADTRPLLDSATGRAGRAVQSAAAPPVTPGVPALGLTTASLAPGAAHGPDAASAAYQLTQSGTRSAADFTHASVLADHVAAAPAHVHDPETFDDGDTATSTFTLHAEGDDATGHFILDESGNTTTIWSENGGDDFDHWSLTETGGFTASFHYVGQPVTTTTVPIDVHESDANSTDPAGFDLDAFNQGAFYTPGSTTTYHVTAGGSEQYHAHVGGTITDDAGDSFGFDIGDHGGDDFSEDDSGYDRAVAGGFDTGGTFNDGDHGDETDTISITGTLAGGLGVIYTNTITSGYHDHDQGSDDEAAGSESGTDTFDDGDNGSDSPYLKITGPVNADGFSGTLTYIDSATDSFHESDSGSDGDQGGTLSGTDHFDDGDTGHHETHLTLQGGVLDPDSGFSGTVLYTDNSSSDYHDADAGFGTPAGDGADTFDDGDQGHEDTSLLVQGSLSDPASGFSGTVLYNPTSGGDYHDADGGLVSETGGVESGHDNFDDGDSGHDGLTFTISGNVNAPDGSFSGQVSYSDVAIGEYHDEDQGPDTDTGGQVDETDNFDAGDDGHETVTQRVQGTVTDAAGGFSGQVTYSDVADGDYHDSDGGVVEDDAGAASGHDTFDDGDGGDDTVTLSITGTVSNAAFTGTVSDTGGSTGTYSDDDQGGDTETGGHDTETDNINNGDGGDHHDDELIQGVLADGSQVEFTTNVDDHYSDGDVGSGTDTDGTVSGVTDDITARTWGHDGFHYHVQGATAAGTHLVDEGGHDTYDLGGEFNSGTGVVSDTVSDHGDDHFATLDQTFGALNVTTERHADDTFDNEDTGSWTDEDGQLTGGDAPTYDESGSGGGYTDESGLLDDTDTFHATGTTHVDDSYTFHNHQTTSAGGFDRTEHYHADSHSATNTAGWFPGAAGRYTFVASSSSETHDDRDSENDAGGWVSFVDDAGNSGTETMTSTAPDGTTTTGVTPALASSHTEWNGANFTITFSRLLPDIIGEDGNPVTAGGTYTSDGTGLALADGKQAKALLMHDDQQVAEKVFAEAEPQSRTMHALTDGQRRALLGGGMLIGPLVIDRNVASATVDFLGQVGAGISESFGVPSKYILKPETTAGVVGRGIGRAIAATLGLGAVAGGGAAVAVGSGMAGGAAVLSAVGLGALATVSSPALVVGGVLAIGLGTFIAANAMSRGPGVPGNSGGSAGRAFDELIKDAAANPSKWKVVRKEVTPSTNVRNKGGTSVQELLRNSDTGEEIVRHTLYRANGSVFEPSHFRPFWK